jgi:transcriptional regulator with XRE-family HTH domain
VASRQPELGLLIKRARERAGLTQQQLADRISRSRKTVDNWENGRTSPRSSIGAVEAVLGNLDGGEAPFIPADDDEARIWAMDEPREWRLKMIAWKRQGEGRARAAG